MKRDDDLIRELLLRVEAGEGSPYDFNSEGFSEDQVLYHLALLIESDYLRGEVLRTGTPDPGKTNVYDVQVEQLTMEGHDFLDAIRDEGVWKSTMEKVTEAVGTAPLAILKAVAVETAKTRLGLG